MDRQTSLPPQESRRRVFVLDDDRDFADSLCNLLTLEGYEVKAAYDLAGALAALEQFPVEVALIDIRLGDQNGLALVSEIRQRRLDVISVVMTAYASVESAIQALQEGAYDFLCKPFHTEDLKATLERCFERLALTRGREAAERDLRIRNKELEALNALLKRTVVSMQALSMSATLPALYTTAIEIFAHNIDARNVALYLIEGSEFVLHQALSLGPLSLGLPMRIQLPTESQTLRQPMFRIEIPGPLVPATASDKVAAGYPERNSLFVFPLTDEEHKPIGLLVLQTDPDATVSEQERELALILVSFVNEAIRLLQALNNARWSEARLREIIDNSPSLISLNDLQGRYLVVNRQFEAWHGLTANEVVGRTPSDVFSPDVARLYQPRSAAARGEDGIIEEELGVVMQDGAMHTVLVTRFPVRDTISRPIGTGIIATDVTDRRRAEEQLRRAQKMEAIGQLTGGIAHDFNNLLAVIIGNLDLLREEFGDRGRNRELIDDCLSSAVSGRELVKSLLAFGGQQRLLPEPTDPNEIILGLSRVLERTVGQAIEMRWMLEDLSPIVVDKSLLETSLLNLVLNARDAMPRGGILAIETKNTVVKHACVGEHGTIAPGSYVTLTVTDTGSGMAPAVAAQAIQPFFTTKEPGNGSGLGLSMVYGFVKQSGGYLRISSKPGAGTSITLYFPRAKDGAARARRISEEEVQLRAQGERILVVEDKKSVRNMAKTMLTRLGYTVLDAENASKALALLRQRLPVDLLLTDIVLTGHLNGFDLAKVAKQRHPELKVLFMSGYAEWAGLHRGDVDGEPLVIEKPFTKAILARKVREALAGGS